MGEEDYPVIGSTIPLLRQQKKSRETGDNYFPMFRQLRDILKRTPDAKACVVFKGHEPAVWVLDVTVVQELYTTQNKYFNKHPIIRDLTLELTGRSILFADTDGMWRKRRTALGPAFYKGKLVQMIDLAKESMRGTLKRW